MLEGVRTVKTGIFHLCWLRGKVEGEDGGVSVGLRGYQELRGKGG